MPNIISFSNHFMEFFRNDYPKLPSEQQKIISTFIAEYIQHGFNAPPLCGRNKSSADIPDDRKREFALEHGLWHYHIGIPCYATRYGIGNWTSEQIVHYVNKNCKATIKLVCIDKHPPFVMPSFVHIQGEVTIK